jgi:hypothetical protein
LRSVQLVLDLPQFRIIPGSRVLCLSTGKTGRVAMWYVAKADRISMRYVDHVISFPSGKIQTVERHLLVEIQ